MITKEVATAIANSQSDLGGKSKERMIEYMITEDKTIVLDPISELIAQAVLDAEGETDDEMFNDIENQLQYHIDAFVFAKTAVIKLTCEL